MNLASHPETLERGTPAIRVHPDDNVAVALRAIEAGEIVELADAHIAMREAIETGHKFALTDIAAGETVRKFGWPIGRTTACVATGEHVHAHNMQTLLSGVESYHSEEFGVSAPLPSAVDASFLGYVRSDGRVGTRNEIWILPTVGCVARTAERIASIASARHSKAVDGIHAFSHPFGCSQLG